MDPLNSNIKFNYDLLTNLLSQNEETLDEVGVESINLEKQETQKSNEIPEPLGIKRKRFEKGTFDLKDPTQRKIYKAEIRKADKKWKIHNEEKIKEALEKKEKLSNEISLLSKENSILTEMQNALIISIIKSGFLTPFFECSPEEQEKRILQNPETIMEFFELLKVLKPESSS